MRITNVNYADVNEANIYKRIADMQLSKYKQGLQSGQQDDQGIDNSTIINPGTNSNIRGPNNKMIQTQSKGYSVNKIKPSTPKTNVIEFMKYSNYLNNELSQLTNEFNQTPSLVDTIKNKTMNQMMSQMMNQLLNHVKNKVKRKKVYKLEA